MEVLQKTVVDAAKVNVPPAEPKPVEDLALRAAKVTLPEVPSKPPVTEDATFDVNAINNVKTVDEAKKWAEQSHKSWQRGVNQKMQELAAERKAIAEERERNKQQQNWTPERIQQELARPDFVNAVKSVVGDTQSIPDEGSMLTDSEKSRLQEIDRIKKQQDELQQIINQQNLTAQWQKQDEELAKRYGNFYNPDLVNQLYQQLMKGDVQATREHLHKVLTYEDYGKRCYELGKQDRQVEVTSKIGASSFDGQQSVEAGRVPVSPVKGERTANWFMRQYEQNKDALSKLAQQKT